MRNTMAARGASASEVSDVVSGLTRVSLLPEKTLGLAKPFVNLKN